MSFEEDAQRHYRQQLDYYRGRVKRMESGEETYGSRHAGSEWVDITAQEIIRDKEAIKVYEGLLKRSGSAGEVT